MVELYSYRQLEQEGKDQSKRLLIVAIIVGEGGHQWVGQGWLREWECFGEKGIPGQKVVSW